MQYQDRRSISVLECCQCCNIVFGSLNIFISERLYYLLPIKMVIKWMRGAPFPWGRLHWIGIIFFHPEVKLQQQCQTQKTIFDLRSYHTTGSILFFSGRGRVPIYPGDRNRRIGRKNENDNPVRKCYICSSIITLIFGF